MILKPKVIVKLLFLYIKILDSCVDMLDGVFAFFLYDKRTNDFFVARDPIGVNPLYYAINEIGELCFTSEMKAIENGIVVVKSIFSTWILYG